MATAKWVITCEFIDSPPVFLNIDLEWGEFEDAWTFEWIDDAEEVLDDIHTDGLYPSDGNVKSIGNIALHESAEHDHRLREAGNNVDMSKKKKNDRVLYPYSWLPP